MVLIREFRIIMPYDPDSYRRAKTNLQETSGSQGIELKKAEAFEKDGRSGHYTQKVYHLESRIPGWVRVIVPSSALKLDEESWDSYPHCKTTITSPFLGERFSFTIETIVVENDRGDLDNALGLDEAQLKKRSVVYVNLLDKPEDKSDYHENEDPSLMEGRELKPGWEKTCTPYLCAYKLVTVRCNVFGFQTKAESMVMNFEHRIFSRFHKQIYCWHDEWINLSLDEIIVQETKMYGDMMGKLELPAKTKKELEEEEVKRKELEESDSQEEKKCTKKAQKKSKSSRI